MPTTKASQKCTKASPLVLPKIPFYAKKHAKVQKITHICKFSWIISSQIRRFRHISTGQNVDLAENQAVVQKQKSTKIFAYFGFFSYLCTKILTTMLRQAIDKIMQGAIRLVMLTGVTFTVTACYGLPPEERYYDRYPEGPQTQQPAEQESAADAEELVDQLFASDISAE